MSNSINSLKTIRRGSRLYDDLVCENKEKVEPQSFDNVKGRNKLLLQQRNDCLLIRYYFYAKVSKKKYDEVINLLSHEFFISERTVSDLVGKETEALKNIFKEKPTIKELENKFYFLNWKQ